MAELIPSKNLLAEALVQCAAQVEQYILANCGVDPETAKREVLMMVKIALGIKD